MDLANELLRETYRKRSRLPENTNRSMAELRDAVIQARRFVMDTSMSRFMADLTTVPFEYIDKTRRRDAIDSLRYSALLPFPKIWVEFNCKQFMSRLGELRPKATDPWGRKQLGADTHEIVAWLLEQHPQYPFVINMTQFVLVEGNMYCMPFSWVYSTSEEQLPKSLEACFLEGVFSHGLTGFLSDHIGVVYKDGKQAILPKDRAPVSLGSSDSKLNEYFKGRSEFVHFLVAETAGSVRHAMALLAALNECPVEHREVEVKKQFLGGGRYRKFLEHTVIRLVLPRRISNPLSLAKRLIISARRKAHEVRGHWRVYQRHNKGLLCEGEHVWLAADETGHARCANCTAWRTHIKPYNRGDASLGFVTHSYSVGHHAHALRKDRNQT